MFKFIEKYIETISKYMTFLLKPKLELIFQKCKKKVFWHSFTQISTPELEIWQKSNCRLKNC